MTTAFMIVRSLCALPALLAALVVPETSSLGNRQLYPGQPFNIMATVRVRMN
jgi:hypothetical protein